jgi:hypothetical protein
MISLRSLVLIGEEMKSIIKNVKHKKAVLKSKNDRSHNKCGLCGATDNLVKTECCEHWICNDHNDYVLFSYARNSCARNHDRFTLCGFHKNEGHTGKWQDCKKCLNSFETEIYVYYGTNEYNFEKLIDPPKFNPTHCYACESVINLGEGGYCLSDGKYFCSLECSDSKKVLKLKQMELK